MKIKRFQRFLREKNIDLAIVQNFYNKDINLFYFIGMHLDYSFLLIPKKGNSRLLTSKLEYERAKKFSGIKDVKIFEKPVFEYLAKLANRRGRNIGINKSVLSLTEFRLMKKNFKNKRYVDMSKILMEQRKAKSSDEIAKIRKACKITDEIFSKLVRNFKFRTELDVEKFIRKEAQKRGCTLSFNPIVASGKNSSMPHFRASERKLKKGFLILDFGVKYKGYMSDMTRTLYLGTPKNHEKKIYMMLLKIQEETLKKVHSGMKVERLMQFVIESLGKHRDNFIHGLGHGIGVQIHELPSIGLGTKERFTKNNVFTIEPGVYFPGKFGIRIEDDVLIGNRTEVLTKSTKKLVTIR